MFASITNEVARKDEAALASGVAPAVVAMEAVAIEEDTDAVVELEVVDAEVEIEDVVEPEPELAAVTLAVVNLPLVTDAVVTAPLVTGTVKFTGRIASDVQKLLYVIC